MTEIGLLGSGNQANELESYLDQQVQVAFRAVSSEYLDKTGQLIDIHNPGSHKTTPVIVSVGTPGVKQKLVNLWPGKTYYSAVSTSAITNTDLKLGAGSIIAPGVVITSGVVIGDHVLVNIGATISHDCRIGNFSTISPGAHLGGHVELGEGVFVGIGASIVNDVKVASGTVIGAGAVVLKDVELENSVVVGVPGKTLRQNNGWLTEL